MQLLSLDHALESYSVSWQIVGEKHFMRTKASFLTTHFQLNEIDICTPEYPYNILRKRWRSFISWPEIAYTGLLRNCCRALKTSFQPKWMCPVCTNSSKIHWLYMSTYDGKASDKLSWRQWTQKPIKMNTNHFERFDAERKLKPPQIENS